ncbi:MAG: hypothetical protein AVDCRST_MAG14-265, partial [uncultured Rubrobacteraceae bacterium]
DRSDRRQEGGSRSGLSAPRRRAARPLRIGGGRGIRCRAQRPGFHRVFRADGPARSLRPLLRFERRPGESLRPRGGPGDGGGAAQGSALRRGRTEETHPPVCGL